MRSEALSVIPRYEVIYDTSKMFLSVQGQFFIYTFNTFKQICFIIFHTNPLFILKKMKYSVGKMDVLEQQANVSRKPCHYAVALHE